MKVYISVDMEGLWGVVSTNHVRGEGEEYQRGRKLMTEEVNIVCEELFNNGAAEIVVNDSHGPMNNIIIEKLHPDVNLISGYPKELSMMEGIDESFDCAMFIGYHPKVGTQQGIFDHTYSGRVVSRLTVNGEEIGESGLNALVAGHFHVPIVLVSGDDKVTMDVKKEIGDIETVTVKETISRYCAKNLSYNQLKEAYKKAITKAIKNVENYAIKKYANPLTMTLEFFQSVMADQAISIPQIKRVNSKTVAFTAKDPVELYKVFRALVSLAGSV